MPTYTCLLRSMPRDDRGRFVPVGGALGREVELRDPDGNRLRVGTPTG